MSSSGNDMNRDPISGAPGAHPIGTGLGATAGAAAGAAVGTAGGPVGTIIGGAIGAIAGGLAGKAGGEAANPTGEAEYWQQTHDTQPYASSDYSYTDYAPAYELGYNSRGRYQSQSFDQVQSEMRSEWERNRGGSPLSWEQAMPATRAAWHRVERVLPGDADGDGI